jgi:hypothetical protein
MLVTEMNANDANNLNKKINWDWRKCKTWRDEIFESPLQFDAAQ